MRRIILFILFLFSVPGIAEEYKCHISGFFPGNYMIIKLKGPNLSTVDIVENGVLHYRFPAVLVNNYTVMYAILSPRRELFTITLDVAENLVRHESGQVLDETKKMDCLKL